ncbi:hypothetical protein [Alkalibaculum bacchi]|uniref:hypothetical protein n=1 Tax=Alkalibaculum bacchi TaxID=645887 RepID=UPI0026EE36F1|nr:hypothetical protein [Alkalibaculum bacchi]
MNGKALRFIKNMSYTISSNLISLIVSTLVILIVPKLIGVKEYGYWQLYLFYSSYVGFLHFGWNDGIYLRYGGFEYNKLDKKLFFSQFISLLSSQIVIGIFIWIITMFFVNEMNRAFILKMTVMTMVIENLRIMLLYILQITNRIKEYARVTISDRIVYILLIITFLIVGVRDYKFMIIADLVGKLTSLVYSMILCKEIVFNRVSNFYFNVTETITNISSGIKLMFANIASTLIIGIVKFGVERTWDVSTFGRVSLTLSISNMMMIFINAVGIILFPILRRTSREKLSSIYSIMRDFLMVLSLGALTLYYPLKTIMVAWLPQYAESLLYMALVFPMFIYEGKMAFLINTYLKTLRREKVMLQINVITMLCSLFMTYIVTQIFNNLNIAILNIVILLAFRSVLAELYLSKELNLNVKKDVFLELLLTLIFILSGWFINSWFTVLIYGMAYIIYLTIKKKDITKTIISLRLLMKA